MSKVLTDQIEKRTGGTAIDVPATGKWPQGNIADDAIGADQLAADAVGTAALSATGTPSATTFLRGDNSWAAIDTSGIDANKDDIALLGFKVAANGSLAKYNLVDQTVDAFEDASGVNAGSSTNEYRDSSGNYYYGKGFATPTVSGNWDSTAIDGDYTYYKWTTVTSSGSFTTNMAQDAEYLVVAGGGGGGRGQAANSAGGGGGAGGFRTATGFPLAAATISGITVGAGGVERSDGADSVFSTITATGGGRGADNSTDAGPGGSGGGGNGGGGALKQPYGPGNTPSTSPSQGNNGGQGGGASYTGAAGGGGASAVGVNSVNGGSHGSAGGAGTASSITGSSVTYAGGGGGGGDTGSGGAGGAGGGAAGGNNNQTGGTGTANTGGGAGGGAVTGATPGGVGGSGIVILRRETIAATEGGDMVLVSANQAAQAAPTKGDIVLTYTNNTGTTTLDTDLTAEISADGGSTWTALALASEGSTGSHNIATSHNVTISSTITAPYNMAYRIKTLNQSAASKTTRIQAVSLGWS